MNRTQSHQALEQLKRTHLEMESELHDLLRRRHLTPRELERAQIIKKEKLRTKDKMRLLMHRARQGQ